MSEEGNGRGLGAAGWLIAVCWYGVAAWVVLEYLAGLAIPAWKTSGQGLAGWASRAQGAPGLLVLVAAGLIVCGVYSCCEARWRAV